MMPVESQGIVPCADATSRITSSRLKPASATCRSATTPGRRNTIHRFGSSETSPQFFVLMIPYESSLSNTKWSNCLLRKCDFFEPPSDSVYGIPDRHANVVGASGVSPGFRDQVIPSETDQIGVHVNGNDVCDIAWGLGSLLDDIGEAALMGKRVRKLVERHFTWDKVADSTIDVYGDVVVNRRKC